MNSVQPQMTWRRAVSILWFPIFFAVVLPVAFQVSYEQQTPHRMEIAAVGNANRIGLLSAQLHRVSANGFEIRRLDSLSTATAEVRERKVDAAYAAGVTGTVYVARAASAIRATYLQGVFTRIAAGARRRAPGFVDLVPLESGDGGTGIFFFVFPLMMAGLIAAIVLLQLPSWRIGRRVAFVTAVGAISALAAYLTVVGLDVLPGKLLLLVYAFLLSQVYGQLMVGAAPPLKQYFLPVSLTAALILSVPSSGGTIPPDLLPAFFRDLNYVLPLAQGVKVTRAVAYFHSSGIAQATLVLGLWAAIAAGIVAVAWRRQPPVAVAGAESVAGLNGMTRVADAPVPAAT
ncbi:MAG TPA: hypothetical protein VGI50_04095 [Solirubrobacteraceae bacterium]